MQKFNYNTLLPLIIMTMASVCMSIVRYIVVGNTTYFFMAWNIALAWMPFLLSGLCRNAYDNGKSKLSLLFFIPWVLFFPNAPYMLTDYIHLETDEFHITVASNYIFNHSINLWYDFILLSIYIFAGLIIGYISFYQMHVMVKDICRNKTNPYISEGSGAWGGWLFVTFMAYLSGFAIYLGRFPRLNSWTILSHPDKLITGVINSLNKNALAFTLLFGTFLLIIYISLYTIFKPKFEDTNKEI